MTEVTHKRPVEIVRLYVIEALEREVDFIVDDPFGTFAAMTPTEILGHMQKLDRIAEICDADLGSLIVAQATEHEFKRLRQFLKNVRVEADALS